MVDPDDCQLSLVAHRAPETHADLEYGHLLFAMNAGRAHRRSMNPTSAQSCSGPPRTSCPPTSSSTSEGFAAYAHNDRLMLEGWGTSEPTSFS